VCQHGDGAEPVHRAAGHAAVPRGPQHEDQPDTRPCRTHENAA